jgi:TetR/AcrR family transcriptional regulator, transcriptional repressor for nem operon
MSTAENAPALIRSAGRLFRTKGIDGVGVADICKAAGLTHGALYGQFGSKQALVAETLAQHSFYLDRPQKHSAAPRTEGV